MRISEGHYTSPLFTSILGLNSVNKHDTLSFCGEGCKGKGNSHTSAVIHLHGFGGSWSLLCWNLSRPINELGMLMACPSLGPLGMWGSETGINIVKRTIEDLKQKGIQKIYLSGISAGAVGVAEMAKKFEDQIEGIILLFGAYPDIDLVETPTLLIYGNEDERFPAKLIQWVITQRQKKKPG